MKIEKLIEEIFNTTEFEKVENDSEFDLYRINNKVYAIINLDTIEPEYNNWIDSIFDDFVYEVPCHWRKYIDQEKWTEDYVNDYPISDYIEDRLYDSFEYAEWYEDLYGYTIYEIELE